MKRLLFALMLLPAQAAAQPVGCDQIAKTKIPYQITYRNLDNTTRVNQVYRSDRGYRTVIQNDNGFIKSTVFQNIFLKSQHVKDKQVMSTEWSVPTDQAMSERPPTTSWKSAMTTDGRTEEAVTSFKQLGRADFFLSPCVYEVVKFSLDRDNLRIPKNKKDQTEIWFSQELNAILKSRNETIDADGYKTERGYEAVELITSFIPLR